MLRVKSAARDFTLRPSGNGHTTSRRSSTSLCRKKFFLDIQNQFNESKLKADIMKAGGIVETFLTSGVHYLISDDPNAALCYKFQEANKMCDIAGRDSPMLLARSFDFDKDVAESQRSELKQKVDRLQIQGYLKDALKLNVKVRTYEGAQEWFSGVEHVTNRSQKPSVPYSSHFRPVMTRFVKPVKKRTLEGFAIKIQDTDGKYRPVYKTLNLCDFQLNLAPGKGSPFDPPEEPCTSTPRKSFKSPLRERRTASVDSLQMVGRPPKAPRKSKKASGRPVEPIDKVLWCDLCECQVESMRSHLLSAQHMRRSESAEVFAELDAELAKDYQMQGFLTDCENSLSLQGIPPRDAHALPTEFPVSDAFADIQKPVPDDGSLSVTSRPGTPANQNPVVDGARPAIPAAEPLFTSSALASSKREPVEEDVEHESFVFAVSPLKDPPVLGVLSSCLPEIPMLPSETMCDEAVVNNVFLDHDYFKVEGGSMDNDVGSDAPSPIFDQRFLPRLPADALADNEQENVMEICLENQNQSEGVDPCLNLAACETVRHVTHVPLSQWNSLTNIKDDDDDDDELPGYSSEDAFYLNCAMYEELCLFNGADN